MHSEAAGMKRLHLLLLAALILAGCGSSSNVLIFEDPAPEPLLTYRIGVLAPLDAGQVEFGRGIRNGAQLAVDQWNGANPNGPLFELVAFDDSSDPAVGLAAAQQLVTVPALTGVVGTYNSGVATAVLPTLQSAGIALVSPGNTDPTLTLGANPDAPSRPYNNYFRLVVPDNLQGPALAEYAFSELGITEAGLLTESKSVSQGLADSFTERFTELGGTITASRVAPEGTTDYSALLDDIALTNPQLLFYAGEVPNASLVREQATAAGIVVPIMGGDGMKAQAYIDGANVSTEGDIASSLGAPAELLPSAAQFLTDYAAAGFAEPPSDFGPYAYDAANLLIAGTLAGRGDRGTVLAFLEAVDDEGATGRLSFDSFGDTLNKLLTVYVVLNNEFLPIEIVTITP
jgi:branched-chain amino acid transport system substrate-binding protein